MCGMRRICRSNVPLDLGVINMWPFATKTEPLWKEESRAFLRQEKMMPTDPWDSMDIVNIYAIKYTDILSGKTKIGEIRELVW